MEEVIICAGARTPIGKINGQLSSFSAVGLGSIAIKKVAEDASQLGLLDEHVSEVFMGHVITAGCGMNTARQAAVVAQMPASVPAATVNMVCGSGLKAIALGAQAISCGNANVVIAGGMESMSNAPHLVRLRGAANGKNSLPTIPKFGDMTMVDSLIKDGLVDPELQCKMGDTAEYVASIAAEVSRTDQDEFALRSHKLWAAASRQRLFDREVIAPVSDSGSVTSDEAPRPNLSIEQLSRLSPVFNVPNFIQPETAHHRSVTAGNASGLSDGAAAVVLASGRFLKEKHGSYAGALARLVTCQQFSGEALLMGIAPVSACKKALAKAGWEVEEVDFWEINEAFAATTVATIRELKIPDWQNRVNVFGGSIAMGHPLGATGARLAVTLSYQLHAAKQSASNGKKFRGVATACIGGGQAIAICLESL